DRRAMTLHDILCYLARTLDRCRADVARAHVYALVAEFAQTKFGCLHGLDVLRAAVRSFRDEGPQAKMQVLELSARLVCLAPRGGQAAAEPGAGPEDKSKAESKNAAAASGPLAPVLEEHRELLAGLHAFAFTLARYDTSFDVRDRARTLRALCPLAGDEAHSEEMPRVLEMAKELIGSATTDTPAAADSLALGAGQFTVASLSLTLGRPVTGYAPLADWPLENVRGVDRGASVANLGPGPGPGRNLGSPGGASIAGAISIAGISGRAQPSGGNTDYSTPRSHVANNEEDLDAFLDSVDDSSSHTKMKNFAHAQESLQKTAILYHQSNISSDSESTSESEEESESDDGDAAAAPVAGVLSAALGASESSESRSESSGSKDESGSQSDSQSDSQGDSQNESEDDERKPFIPAAQTNRHSTHAHSKNSGGSHSDDDDSSYPGTSMHSRPLIEDTSKYWQ
ncbi:AP-3 complex subunit beta, partial [Kickxella alabastrina]